MLECVIAQVLIGIYLCSKVKEFSYKQSSLVLALSPCGAMQKVTTIDILSSLEQEMYDF